MKIYKNTIIKLIGLLIMTNSCNNSPQNEEKEKEIISIPKWKGGPAKINFNSTDITFRKIACLWYMMSADAPDEIRRFPEWYKPFKDHEERRKKAEKYTQAKQGDKKKDIELLDEFKELDDSIAEVWKKDKNQLFELSVKLPLSYIAASIRVDDSLFDSKNDETLLENLFTQFKDTLDIEELSSISDVYNDINTKLGITKKIITLEKGATDKEFKIKSQDYLLDITNKKSGDTIVEKLNNLLKDLKLYSAEETLVINSENKLSNSLFFKLTKDHIYKDSEDTKYKLTRLIYETDDKCDFYIKLEDKWYKCIFDEEVTIVEESDIVKLLSEDSKKMLFYTKY